MKKILTIALLLFALVALVACGNNGDTYETPTEQNENNSTDDVVEESPTINLPAQEIGVGDYPIIINGVGFIDWDGSKGSFYTLQNEQLPTHVRMSVLDNLGIVAVQGGSQVALLYNDEFFGVSLSVKNYLAFGADRAVMGIDDTFMADDGYFTQYIPISLLRVMGFDVNFQGGSVHIDGELNVQVNPHPIAIALQNFIASSEGETKALWANIGAQHGTVQRGIVAIEFVNQFFANATLFAYTYTERDVISKEIGSIDGFPFSLGFTTDGWGNLLKVTGDGGNKSYTMLGISTNPLGQTEEIVSLFTIYAESDGADDEINYYRFDGDWLEGIEGGRHLITAEEFYETRANFGQFITCWRDLGDSTNEILTLLAHLWRGIGA